MINKMITPKTLLSLLFCLSFLVSTSSGKVKGFLTTSSSEHRQLNQQNIRRQLKKKGPKHRECKYGMFVFLTLMYLLSCVRSHKY